MWREREGGELWEETREEEEFEGTAVACVYLWVHLKDPSALFPI